MAALETEKFLSLIDKVLYRINYLIGKNYKYLTDFIAQEQSFTNKLVLN